MTPLRKAVFATILSTTTFSFAANLPRNPNIVICQPNAGCIHHTIFGHDYKMLSTDRFSVMVFLSTEGRYTRADVSITNFTPTPINLSPKTSASKPSTPGPKSSSTSHPRNSRMSRPQPGPPQTTPRRSRIQIQILRSANSRQPDKEQRRKQLNSRQRPRILRQSSSHQTRRSTAASTSSPIRARRTSRSTSFCPSPTRYSSSPTSLDPDWGGGPDLELGRPISRF